MVHAAVDALPAWRTGPHPELVASAVAAAFTGVLADWLHDTVPAGPADLAHHLWRLLLALRRAA